MSSQSSRLPRVLALGATSAAIVIGAIAATGCGSDEENNAPREALEGVQSQVSSVQSQISTAARSVQEQAESLESQVQSVKTQIQTQTESNGGSSAGGGYGGY